MPTATATSTETAPEQEQVLPPALWRAFRDERRMGSKQREAVSHAFEKAGIQKSDTRERLRPLLLAKESADGLALTSREIEDEIAAEGVPDVPAEPEPGSTEAIERDARQRVEELRAQIERMAPEALVDATVATEQKAAESELADAEHALTNVTRARGEITRRQESAAEQAQREHRESANAAAAKLEPVIAKQLAAVDRVLAAALVPEVEKLAELMSARRDHLVSAGLDAFSARGVQFRAEAVESAIRFAFQSTGLGLYRGTDRAHPLGPEEVKS